MITTWGTWDGRMIKYERLTWQHLSNIHYYMKYILRDNYRDCDREFVFNTLTEIHGGILPYHPDHRFDFEKERLIELGYLKDNGDIVIDGEKIGWYEEPLKKNQEYYDELG